MSDYIDTRDGWHEVPITGRLGRGKERVVRMNAGGVFQQVWVREEPVPPLPTEPYTVILTKGKRGFSDWVMIWYGEQWHQSANGTVISAAELSNLITSFEVLSEPRAVTAKAVLARVRQEYPDTLRAQYSDGLDCIAEEFGVSQ